MTTSHEPESLMAAIRRGRLRVGTYQGVPGGHALLDRPWRWHALAARAVVELAARG